MNTKTTNSKKTISSNSDKKNAMSQSKIKNTAPRKKSKPYSGSKPSNAPANKDRYVRRGGQQKHYQAGGYQLKGQDRHPDYSTNQAKPSQAELDKQNQGKLRIIPLGGLEEVGRNMTLFEYEKDIIIVDMGMQFPDEEMPGIDYVIPNSRYLRDKIDRIRGVLVTHGHLDHIGAIPHHIRVLGNPPIYTGRMTKAIIEKRQEDYKDNPKLNISQVKPKQVIDLGVFKVEFIHVCHSIPDALGLAIHTPVGTIIHSGDFKFDQSPIGEEPTDIGHLAIIANKGVLALMADSTDAGLPGFTISESKVKNTFEKIIQEAKGRIIAGTFSTLITRIRHMVEISEKYGKKIAVDGYSMKTNVEIARKLGYIKAKKETFIDISQVNNYPPNKIIVMCTGAQGEGNAVLMRIANMEHRYVQPVKGDTIIFSSSVIPGNERTVQAVKDNLYKKGVQVVHYKMMDVHSGGHAKSEDLKLLFNLIKPKYLIPIHGNHFMLRLHGELASSLGMPEENVLIGENGRVMEFNHQGQGRLKQEKVPANYVMVDGLGVGDIGNVVLRERLQMAQDGMFVIIVTIDSKEGNQIGNADLISRGFIYMKNNQELLKQTRAVIRDIIQQKAGGRGSINWEYIRNSLRDDVGQFLFNKTQRRPMVLPVIIEV
ncbi:MAG: RNase J family beta-CASP ribonuclease [Candidatus Moranbacteria bacterium]|nr:RNase J family beta-CASP ribonuclease [Candidatus Moranbacteria bacterium]